MMLTRAVAATAAALAYWNPMAALAADAPKAPVPIEDFVRAPQFAGPVLSPDGEHLVVTRRVKEGARDIPVMSVYNLKQKKEVATVRLPLFEVPGGYTWVSNKRLLVKPAREYGFLEAPVMTGEVLAMDLDGANQQYLFGYAMSRRAKRGSIFGDDRASGYVAHVPREQNGTFLLREEIWEGSRTTLYQIDSSSAARKMVVDIDVPQLRFLMQSDGKPRFAYGYAPNAKSVLYRRDDEKGTWLPQHDEEGITFLPIAFTPDNLDFYAVVHGQSAADGTAPSALVKQSTASGRRTQVGEMPVGSVNLFEWGPRPSQPIAYGTYVGRPSVRYPDPANPESTLHRQLSEQFPTGHVSFLNFSDDGQKLLFGVSSDRAAYEYFLLDRKEMKAEQLFAVRPWLDPARMGQRRPINFRTRDGLSLHGYVTLPAGHAGGPLPLVLLPHGGPEYQSDDWFFHADAQFIASRGYAVLQINQRGSGGRGLEFERRGYGQWGGAMIDDLVDGVRWAIEQKVAEPARVCAYGAGFGAYAAMMATIRAPELFKCAVGYAGIYDLPQVYDEHRTKTEKQRLNRFVRLIGRDAETLARQSPSRLVDQLKAPVLLVHGKEDWFIPPEQAETMRDALTKAGKPHEWLMVPEEGHGFYAEKNRVLFYQRLEAFLAKHIGR